MLYDACSYLMLLGQQLLLCSVMLLSHPLRTEASLVRYHPLIPSSIILLSESMCHSAISNPISTTIITHVYYYQTQR